MEEDLTELTAALRKLFNIRTQNGIPVRYPLARIILPDTMREKLKGVEEYLLEAINVKAIEYHKMPLRISPNYGRVGPRLGNKMDRFVEAVDKLDPEQVMRDRLFYVRFDENDVELFTVDDVWIVPGTPDDARPNVVYASTKDMVVGLDVSMNDGLALEGFCNELVRVINRTRADMGLQPDDVITIMIEDKYFIWKVINHTAYTQDILERTNARHITSVNKLLDEDQNPHAFKAFAMELKIRLTKM